MKQLDELGPTYTARPYTDGSYDATASLEAYFHPLSPNGRVSAALIIKDTTEHWRRRPILVMYISDRHAIGATSVYTMEYLALPASLHLSAVISTLHATGCDAKSVLKSIPGRRRKLSHLHKDHHYLLQGIDGSLHRGAPTPYHVRAHADTRKPKKDSRGRYGLKWTEDDWGNYIADRLATESEDDLLFHGLHLIKTDITAVALYNSLGHPGQ